MYEVEKQAFSFPSEVALIDTPWKENAKLAIETRYRFLPYNYTLAYKQAKHGQPLIAPLYYYFPSDTTAANVQDQFMWGDRIMVAPVVEKGAKTRQYYLPAGKWISLNTEHIKILTGEKWYEDSITMNAIPVYAKEGSFIVQDFEMFETHNTSITQKVPPSKVVNHLVSVKPSADSVYMDDGESKSAITGNNKLIVFSSRRLADGSYEISILTRGKYQQGRKDDIILLISGFEGQPASITVNGAKQNTRWKEKTLAITLSHLRSTKIIIR